jgi:hypothetical protein
MTHDDYRVARSLFMTMAFVGEKMKIELYIQKHSQLLPHVYIVTPFFPEHIRQAA